MDRELPSGLERGVANGAAADDARPKKKRAPYAKSEHTRSLLVSNAERLFSQYGILSVTLNDISRAAKQKHSNVCQYHFGDKTGLIQAIFDKHLPAIVAARSAMLSDVEARGDTGIAPVVSALVRPVVAKLQDADGGIAFVRFAAQMIVPAMQMASGVAPMQLTILGADMLHSALLRAMSGQRLSADLVSQRLMMAVIMLFQGSAAFAEVRGFSPDGPAPADDELEAIALELEAMIAGALTAAARDQ